MKTVADRIKHIRKGFQLTQEEFASRLDVYLKANPSEGPDAVSRGAIGNWERGEGIKTSNLQAISDEFAISFEWLSMGRGREPKFKDGRRFYPEGEEFPEDDFDLTEMPHGTVSLIQPYKGSRPDASPDIDYFAGGGPGQTAASITVPHPTGFVNADAVKGEFILPDYLLAEFTNAKAPRVHWIRVKGDSMAPTLLPGERVMVDTTDQSLAQGGVFVLTDPDGDIIVKRLTKLPNGKLRVGSDNPKEKAIEYPINDIRLLGRVVGRLSRV